MNKILEQTQAAILQKSKPQIRQVIDKVVESGKEVMYSPQTRDMTVKAMAEATDAESIGAAVAKLAIVLLNQAKGQIPPEALIPASVVLLCEALAFLEDAGKVEVTPDLLAECTAAMSSNLLQLMGATPEQLQGFIKGGAPAAEPAPAAPPAGGIVAAQGAMQ